MKSVRDATPSIGDVLHQYPFYAVVAGMIAYSGLNAMISLAGLAPITGRNDDARRILLAFIRHCDTGHS